MSLPLPQAQGSLAMVKQKIVLIHPSKMNQSRQKKLDDSGYPYFEYTHFSQTFQTHSTLRIPRDVHMFYENIAGPDITNLVFVSLGSAKIPDLKEYEGRVDTIIFSGNISCLEVPFEIVRRLNPRKVEFILGGVEQLLFKLPSPSVDQGARADEEYEGLIPIPSIKKLVIAMTEHVRKPQTDGEFKQFVFEQFESILRYCTKVFKNVDSVDVNLPDDGSLYKMVKQSLPKWKYLASEHRLQIKDEKVFITKTMNRPAFENSPRLAQAPTPTMIISPTNIVVSSKQQCSPPPYTPRSPVYPVPEDKKKEKSNSRKRKVDECQANKTKPMSGRIVTKAPLNIPIELVEEEEDKRPRKVSRRGMENENEIDGNGYKVPLPLSPQKRVAPPPPTTNLLSHHLDLENVSDISTEEDQEDGEYVSEPETDIVTDTDITPRHTSSRQRSMIDSGKISGSRSPTKSARVIVSDNVSKIPNDKNRDNFSPRSPRHDGHHGGNRNKKSERKAPPASQNLTYKIPKRMPNTQSDKSASQDRNPSRNDNGNKKKSDTNQKVSSSTAKETENSSSADSFDGTYTPPGPSARGQSSQSPSPINRPYSGLLLKEPLPEKYYKKVPDFNRSYSLPSADREENIFAAELKRQVGQQQQILLDIKPQMPMHNDDKTGRHPNKGNEPKVKGVAEQSWEDIEMGFEPRRKSLDRPEDSNNNNNSNWHRNSKRADKVHSTAKDGRMNNNTPRRDVCENGERPPNFPHASFNAHINSTRAESNATITKPKSEIQDWEEPEERAYSAASEEDTDDEIKANYRENFHTLYDRRSSNSNCKSPSISIDSHSGISDISTEEEKPQLADDDIAEVFKNLPLEVQQNILGISKLP